MSMDAWLWAAVLAPAIATLPAALARAGSGGWIAPVLALPVLLAIDRLWERVAGGGIVRGFCGALGVRGGRALTIIYIMWAVLLGGVQLNLCARRMAAVEPAGGWLAAAAVLLLAVWFANGRSTVVARWGVPTLGWLLVGLGTTAGLALMQVRRENLVPLWSDGSDLFGAAVTIIGVLCVRVYGGFLPKDEGTKPDGARPAVLVCGLLGVLQLAVQGCLGAEFAARLENPLLTLSRNVGVEGTFQRAESLVAALLLSADLALVALLLCAVKKGVEQAWRENGKRGRIWAAVAMSACAAVSGGARPETMLALISTGNLLLGIGVPLFILAVVRIRGRKKGAYLVPKSEKNGTS